MVKWKCLIETMHGKSFGLRWIGWICNWLHFSWMQVMMSGELRKEIKCKCGLGQGDLLSPLLFTLVVDGLNMMINKTNKKIGN